MDVDIEKPKDLLGHEGHILPSGDTVLKNTLWRRPPGYQETRRVKTSFRMLGKMAEREHLHCHTAQMWILRNTQISWVMMAIIFSPKCRG